VNIKLNNTLSLMRFVSLDSGCLEGIVFVWDVA
jgi:hypothetical protein